MRYNIYKYAIGALLLCGLLSCSRENLSPESWRSENEISLTAAVPGSSRLLTKASGTDYRGIINSATEVGGGLVLGMLRVDQTRKNYEADGGGLSCLTYKGVNIVSETFNPKDYTFTDSQPHYYCSQANLSGDPGLRYVDFDILQYYKTDSDVVHYYGWYPYGTPVASSTEAFKVNFSLDGKTDVLYSSPATQIQKEKSDTLRLHHALCQYRIWIYRMTEVGEEGTEHAAGRWGRLTDIISHNQCTAATFTLPSTLSYSGAVNFNLKSLPNATLEGTVASGAANGIYYVTKEIESGIEKDGVSIPLSIQNKKQIACYLAPPPSDGNLSLSIDTDETGGGSASTNDKNLSVAGNFQPGRAYDIILCFSDHGVINAFTSVGEWTSFGSTVDVDVEAKMYYDLSRYGTANCYMVSSANVGYSFQGNVKGCGNAAGGGTLVGVDDCSLPEDSHVEILYQSTPNLIKLDAQSLIDGKVLFWVPGETDESSLALVNKGNAIVAVRNGKGGEILWSWHIWVTDRPQDQGYLNGYDVMDRNLGALSGPRTVLQIKNAQSTSYGYYYQWGRKDPMIPGVTSWSDESLSDESTCISTGIKNPLVMYSNWNLDSIQEIMGYRDAQDNVKTIYDPCPPGYRAPESEAFKTLSLLNTTVTGMTGVKGGSFTGDNYNYFFYPDAGFVSANLSHSASSKISVTGANDNNGEIYLYTTAPEDFIDGQTGQVVKIANLPTGSQSSGIDYHTKQESSAFSMRCISSGSKTRVENLCEAQTSNCYIVPSYGAYKFRVDIRGNGVNRVNLGGSMFDINENIGINIDLATINHVAVLWWQGDLSGRDSNNNAGTDCPIKFVNNGKSLPRTPSHNSASFGDKDITVPDSEGYVQFYIGENDWARGNAVVAAFDVNNNVLWSWHLWLTEKPGDINMGPRYNSTDKVTLEYTMMDRNLGATYHPTSSEFTGKVLTGDADTKALASVGLYYQWGRKDPIQGASTFAGTYSSGSTASKNWYRRNVSGDYSWVAMSTIDVQEAKDQMSYGMSNPSVFYKNTDNTPSIIGFKIQEDKTIYEKNWHAYKFGIGDGLLQRIFKGESLKVDRHEINKFIGLWGYNTQSFADSLCIPAMTKTMFDPCPPGYFIPPTAFLAASGITETAYGNDALNVFSSSSFVFSPEKTWTAGTETRGVFLSKGTYTSDADIWVPFGGYRDYESGKFNTARIGSTPTAVWHTGQDYRAEYFEYCSGVRANAIRRDGSGQIRGFRPADAANVRCRAY